MRRSAYVHYALIHTLQVTMMCGAGFRCSWVCSWSCKPCSTLGGQDVWQEKEAYVRIPGQGRQIWGQFVVAMHERTRWSFTGSKICTV